MIEDFSRNELCAHQIQGVNPLTAQHRTQISPPDATHCSDTHPIGGPPVIDLTGVPCSAVEKVTLREQGVTRNSYSAAMVGGDVVILSLSRQSFWLYYHADETECAFVLEMGGNGPFFLLGCLVTMIVLAAVGIGMMPLRSGAWYAMVALVVVLTAALSREVFLLFICRAPTATSDVQGRANEDVQLFRFREVGAAVGMFFVGLYSVVTISLPSLGNAPENFYFAPSWDRAAFDRLHCCSVDCLFLIVLLVPLAIRKPRFFVTAAVAVLLMCINVVISVYFTQQWLPVVARIVMMVVVGVGIMWNVRTFELTDRTLFDHFETTKQVIAAPTWSAPTSSASWTRYSHRCFAGGFLHHTTAWSINPRRRLC